MAFDLSGDAIATFLGVNDAPREPAPSKPGNGAHLIKQHNSLVANTQNIVNQLSAQTNSIQSQVDGDRDAIYNKIAELANAPSSSTPQNFVFAVDRNHAAAPGEKIFLSGFSADFPFTLFLPLPPQPLGAEITFMHNNEGLPLLIKNARSADSTDTTSFKLNGSTKFQVNFSLTYQMVSLIYVGIVPGTSFDYGWISTCPTTNFTDAF